MDIGTGDIRKLKAGERPRPDEVMLDATEAKLLSAVSPLQRMARLAGFQRANNGKRRRHQKNVAKAIAKAEIKLTRFRCAERNKYGQQCNRKPHDRENHSAFGHEWK